jgi:hypothetical protein
MRLRADWSVRAGLELSVSTIDFQSLAFNFQPSTFNYSSTTIWVSVLSSLPCTERTSLSLGLIDD